MATFVWDMAPRRYNLLMTWRLAKTLQEKGHEVYYIQHEDSNFTWTLIKQHLNCSVVYPDDFKWLRPDLILLDCLLVERAPFYRKRGIPYVFVAMQSPERRTDLDADVPVLCLSPVFLSLPPVESARATEQLRRQKSIQRSGIDTFIIGLLETGEEDMRCVYQSVQEVATGHPEFHFILLTRNSKVAEGLFTLPANVEIHQQLHLEEVMKECGVALTSDHPDTWLECTFAGLPFIPMSGNEIRRMTPRKLERQIVETLRNREVYRENERKIRRYFEEDNRKLDAVADDLIDWVQRKPSEL